MTITRNKLRKLVQDGLAKFGDGVTGLRTLVSYVQVAVGPYNPATDTSANVNTVHNDVVAMIVQIKSEERDWFPGDALTQKLLIAYNDLPIVPQLEDFVLINAVRWDVKRIRAIPGTPLHVLFVQEP